MNGDPRGSLAIASLTGGGWSVEHFRIELPIDEICRRIEAAGMPFSDRMCETQRLACRW